MEVKDAVLVTGASGYLGRLIVAVLLAREDHDIVLPVWEKYTPTR